MSGYILIIIGIILVILEIFIPSLFIIWFGTASIVVGLLTYILPMGITIQLILIAIISILALFFIRPIIKKWQNKPLPHKEEFLIETDGEGKIKGGKLYYKGTFWNYKSTLEEKLEEGDVVKVLEIKDNIAYVRKAKRYK